MHATCSQPAHHHKSSSTVLRTAARGGGSSGEERWWGFRSKTGTHTVALYIRTVVPGSVVSVF